MRFFSILPPPASLDVGVPDRKRTPDRLRSRVSPEDAVEQGRRATFREVDASRRVPHYRAVHEGQPAVPDRLEPAPHVLRDFSGFASIYVIRGKWTFRDFLRGLGADRLPARSAPAGRAAASGLRSRGPLQRAEFSGGGVTISRAGWSSERVTVTAPPLESLPKRISSARRRCSSSWMSRLSGRAP